jgi:hypothetical protein
MSNLKPSFSHISATANLFACLEHGNFHAALGEQRGCCQTRDSATDNYCGFLVSG